MKNKEIQIVTGYLDRIYSIKDFGETLKKATKQLRLFKKNHSFDAIAFRGYSGAALAYPLSLRLKIPLICVRKNNEHAHTHYKVEGCINATNYIIVDDFISSGETIDLIKKEIRKTYKCYEQATPKLVGIYLYNDKYRSSPYKKTPIIKI